MRWQGMGCYVSWGCLLAALFAGCGPAAREQQPPAAGPQAPAEPKENAMQIVEHRSGQWTPGLSDAERATLFAIAEDTLRWCVEGGRTRFDFSRYAVTEKLKTAMATFVTLKDAGGDLRGCIGSLAPVDALYRSVHENAVNAALRDPRFPPVRLQELPGLTVHLSLLSPIEDIPGPEAFRIGEHGIIIEKGGSRAVYLPEVAVEQKWTREATLSSLSMKAGLSPDAWRSGARFKVFSSVGLARE